MSEHELPPLDADLRALLNGARDPIAPPLGAEARVLAGVEAIALGPFGGGGGGGAAGGGTASGGAASAGRGAVAASRGVLHRFAPFVATFVLGGAVGAGVVLATVHAPPPVVIQLPPKIVFADAPTVTAPPASSASPSLPPPAATSARGAPASATSAGEQNDLSAERTLLDVARGAIERADGHAALAATREHERRFPTGMLVQEREAMAVRALVLLGRTNEAHTRAARFRARYPESALLPALESAIGAPSSSASSSTSFTSP